MSGDRKTRLGLLLGSALLLLAVFGTQKIHQDLWFQRALSTDTRLAETSYLPPNEVLRFLALGHEPFFADLIFSYAQQYFFTHLVADRKYRWMDNYLDAIVGYCRGGDGLRLKESQPRCEAAKGQWVEGLFPFNPRVYSWVSQVLKFVPKMSNSIVDQAVYYGENGTHFCPDSWELHFDLGFNLYYEYQGLSDQQRLANKKRGLELMTQAARMPGAEIDPNFLVNKMWEKETVADAVRMAYLTYYTGDEIQRADVRMRLAGYGETELATALDNEEKRWKKDFPFLPLRFYQTLGPKSPDTIRKALSEI
jgi:hypothetical protein